MRHWLRSIGAALVEAPSALRLFVVSGIWFVSMIWSRSLTMPDEGRYAGVAWEMLRSGSHAVPLLNGLPYFHKPPLFYWMVEGAFTLFGVHEWSARLPSCLAAWLAAMATYLFVRHYRNAEVATLTLVVLATQPFFYAGAQFANLDMLVASMITLATLAGAAAVLEAGTGKPWRMLAVSASALAGLAILAKGLIGLALPGATLLVWLVLSRRWRGLRVLLWPPAILVFAVVAVPWFWLMQHRYDGFFHYFFVYQHFQRFTQTGFNDVEPFWFYPPVIAVLTLPWSLWLRGVVRKRFVADPQLAELRLLAAIWIVVVVGFFSLPASKLVGYVLPALPPLAYLIAEAVSLAMAEPRAARARRRYALSVGAGVAICCIAVVIATLMPRNSAKPVASKLAHQIAADDTLVMLHTYQFDLPFYAGARRPAWVVEAWDDPQIAARDNWRKELYDAAQFDPAAGKQMLISPDVFRQRLCAGQDRRFWVWGVRSEGRSNDALVGEVPYASDGHDAVWLLKTDQRFRSMHCGAPSAKS